MPLFIVITHCLACLRSLDNEGHKKIVYCGEWKISKGMKLSSFSSSPCRHHQKVSSTKIILDVELFFFGKYPHFLSRMTHFTNTFKRKRKSRRRFLGLENFITSYHLFKRDWKILARKRWKEMIWEMICQIVRIRFQRILSDTRDRVDFNEATFLF